MGHISCFEVSVLHINIRKNYFISALHSIVSLIFSFFFFFPIVTFLLQIRDKPQPGNLRQQRNTSFWPLAGSSRLHPHSDRRRGCQGTPGGRGLPQGLFRAWRGWAWEPGPVLPPQPGAGQSGGSGGSPSPGHQAPPWGMSRAWV